MIVELRFRRAFSVEWSSANPILAAGEPGWDRSVNRFKIGNGVDHWNTLPFQSYDAENLQALIDAAEAAAAAAAQSAAEAAAYGGGGGGGSITEDPSEPGTFMVGAGSAFIEDPNEPGTFLIGA